MATARVERRRAATRASILEAAWDLAREEGLGRIGMRELAGQLEMAASSLYGYFDGKNAIYDAMFIEGNVAMRRRLGELSAEPGIRETLITGARTFVEFCIEDRARFQLLFQNAVPGWQPSAEAYGYAVENFELMRTLLGDLGIADDASIDLWTALTSGLAGQQMANDPDGDRWLRLVERAVDMYIANWREQS